MKALFHAHSGLRYLVLLLGLVSALYSVWGLSAKRPFDKPGRILTAAFVGLLDLQILLGAVLTLAGLYYPRLIGHFVLMLLAAVVAHAGSVMNRRRAQPGWTLPMAGSVGALVFIALGILAIGRPLLGSGR